MPITNYTQVVGVQVSLKKALELLGESENLLEEKHAEELEEIMTAYDGLALKDSEEAKFYNQDDKSKSKRTYARTGDEILLFPLTHDIDSTKAFVLGLIVNQTSEKYYSSRGVNILAIDVEFIVKAADKLRKALPKDLKRSTISLHSIQDGCVCCS